MAWKHQKVYRAWLKMLSRCYDENDDRYRLYGGRGIDVYEDWRLERIGFWLFLRDMGPPPTKKHTLERIDNDGGYSPTNCRWATWKEQAQNRRSNVQITFRGQTRTMAAWAERLGVDRRVLWKRFKLGWSEARALTEPKRNAA